VRELLAAGRRDVRRVLVADGLDPAPVLDEIEALARRRKVRVETVSRARLDVQARTEAPQGVLALAAPVEPVPLEALAATRGQRHPFVVVAAGLSDPHNLGAVLRSAEGAGATAVVLPRHRAAHLSPTATKVAAGAVEHLDFCLVGGIPAALAVISELGFYTVGLAGEATASLYDLDLGDRPLALVVGAEGRGLAPLVRRRCDQLAAIPQHGALESLNVGAAAAVACFEAARQRSARP
jgi:23S rRNA (guanosine2251-2'-O)-methyltransferase